MFVNSIHQTYLNVLDTSMFKPKKKIFKIIAFFAYGYLLIIYNIKDKYVRLRALHEGFSFRGGPDFLVVRHWYRLLISLRLYRITFVIDLLTRSDIIYILKNWLMIASQRRSRCSITRNVLIGFTVRGLHLVKTCLHLKGCFFFLNDHLIIKPRGMKSLTWA